MTKAPAVRGESRWPMAAAVLAVGVLRIEGGLIREMTAFHDPRLFAAFAAG